MSTRPKFTDEERAALTNAGYTARLAAEELRRAFPQSAPRPWRGSEGADARISTVNYGVVHVSLRKDRGLWWAEASGDNTFKPIEEFSSNAREAAGKLRAALLK
jgi:hypothetical protein